MGSAREVILGRMARGYRTKYKPDRSPVTDADIEAEKALRDGIRKRFPDHGIVGEEIAPVNEGSDYRWFIDPIDGTINFTKGIPLFGTILALHYKGEPLLGVIDHPALGKCYSAARGLGASVNGKSLSIQDGSDPIDREILAVGDRAAFARIGADGAFDALMRKHPLVRSYTDCFGHTLAFEGALGAMADFGIRVWDIAATQVIIEEAGGKYCQVRKVKKPGQGTFFGIIFGKPKVVDWVLPFFK